MPVDHVLAGQADKVAERVRQVAREHIAPASELMDHEARLIPKVRSALVEHGLLGMGVPHEYGGAAADLDQTTRAIEEIARVDPGVAVVVDVHNLLFCRTVDRWGTATLRRSTLPRMAAGELGAFALSEPRAGSDAFALTTTATPVDGGYVLNGEKKWTSLAPQADWFLVFAEVRESPNASGLLAVLVARESGGLSVAAPNPQTGVRAACTADLVLNNVFVPGECVLGKPGDGSRIAMDALTTGRVGIAAQLAGLADGALAAAVGYAGHREQFGRTIGSFQGVQLALGTMATDVAAIRGLFRWAAREVRDRPGLPAMRAAAMAKQFAARTAESVVSTAVEVHGGAGYMRGSIVERLYRDVKVGAIYEGTSTILLRTIASTLLGSGAGNG
jgi:butyryl-CoA dehydrogenase